MQPYELTAAAASKLIATKKLSCEELARSTLARIAQRDPAVKAWSYVDQDLVLRNARELDKSPPKSALHGLTFGVKDVIDSVDMPTQQNSPLRVNHWFGQDAACVAVVRHSGALVVGKTDTVEFASGGRLAASRNPHNLDHTPGGSSSGSGAAVGDMQVQLAFGTQTGGSHIRPAAFNGIYAIKPTHGAISREGAKNYSHTCDTVGWYGRSVDDLQLVAQAFRLLDADSVKPVTLRGLKVGLCRSPFWSHADPYSRAALMAAGQRLEAAGAIVTDLTLPEPFNGMENAKHVILNGEGRSAFLPDFLGPKSGLLAQHYLNILNNTTHVTPAKMRAAYDLAAACRRTFDRLFGGELDVVLTPSSTGEAPPLTAQTSGNSIFNQMWTLLNVPCVAIPVGKSPKGLPLGIQLVGPRYSDSQLLAIAQACAPAIHENATLAELTLAQAHVA